MQAKALISPAIWERNIIHTELIFGFLSSYIATTCLSFTCHSSIMLKF